MHRQTNILSVTRAVASMSSTAVLILAVLLLSDTAINGEGPRGGHESRRTSLSHRSQRLSRDRYLRHDSGGAYVGDSRKFMSSKVEVPNFNSIPEEPPQNVCSAEQSTMYFCSAKQTKFTDWLADHRLKMEYIGVPTKKDYFESNTNLVPAQQKRTRGSNCDCRTKNQDFATGKPIYLGNDHYPQFLPSNVTCDHSRCTDPSYKCLPTVYQIKVLVKRKTNMDQSDEQLPFDLQTCWYSKVYTVFTDCMCVYET